MIDRKLCKNCEHYCAGGYCAKQDKVLSLTYTGADCELFKPKHGEWISPAFAMPNPDGEYVLCIVDGDYIAGLYIEDDYGLEGTFNTRRHTYDADQIDYWMKIPEVPKD